MADRDPHDVVCLAKAPNPAIAHIWEQALRDEGIQAKVVGDYLDAGMGDIGSMEAEVWVHREDLNAAKAILEKSETISGESESDEDE